MGKNKIPETGIYDARQLGRGRMLLLGFQHMFAMFGATILVPILTGLDVSNTLLFAGLGTLLFHLITGGKVPAFLGSSFAFLGGYATIAPMLGEQQNIPNLEMLPYACFVVPPKFGSGWTLPSCARDAGCAGPAISARCALYACSADVLPGAAARAFQRHGPLSGQAESRYCFRVVAKIKIIGSFSCSSSSCANPDRRAAIRGSAFLPRPDLSRTGRWTNRTGEACA